MVSIAYDEGSVQLNQPYLLQLQKTLESAKHCVRVDCAQCCAYHLCQVAADLLRDITFINLSIRSH